MMTERATRIVALVGWALLTAYASLVIRDFFRFADTLVYVALDDGLANQSYMLAEHGRYGFMSSPTLLGVPRHHGEVSYGPWYFYAGAGLIWFFGYSLTLVRSIHLWVIVGAVAAAAWWFPRRDAPVAALVFGLGVLFCFEAAMWPMARPDSSVTAFAVLMVIASGLAITTDRVRHWFVAGLAAGCAATAHLIAWSLVPAVLVLFAYWAWERWRSEIGPDRRRGILPALVALAAGGLLAVFLFYASFGFRLDDQLKMFDAYRDLVSAPGEDYWSTLARHFSIAFEYLREWQRQAIVALLAAAWITVAVMARQQAAERRRLLAYLLPPLVVWTAYLGSSGAYVNHHRNYAILQQVMSIWTAAALVAVWIARIDNRSRSTARWVAVAASLVLSVQATRLIAWQRDQGVMKSERASRWVSGTEYTDRLIGGVPAGATAWGAVVYGIETPDRLQLVQVSEGLVMLRGLPPGQRAALIPEFLIWGYPEVRDNALINLRGGDSLLNQVAEVLPGAAYRVVSIVSGPPYGVSRVYARTTSPARHEAMPQIHSYDAARRRWRTRIGGALPVAFVAAPSMPIRADYSAAPPAAQPANTVTAELPPGAYILRVRIRPGAGTSKRRMLAAVSADAIEQTFGELGPRGDFAGYFLDQSPVILHIEHTGGQLVVSQFDDGAGAAIVDVDTYPVMAEPGGAPALRIPARTFAAGWTAVDGVSISHQGERLIVAGNDSSAGYQVLAPPVPASRNDGVSIELDLSVEAGKVCTGVLNGNQAVWIVPPESLQRRLSFRMDASGKFFAVVANCHNAPAPASRFSVDGARYTVQPATLYADRLMHEAFASDDQQ